jgi:hypothetical protein
VPGDGGLLGALLSDPLALYPALAALVLASVSLASGLLRGDALALSRPMGALWLLVSIGAAWGLGFAASLTSAPWTEIALGLARLPLYLVALAYGAVPGLVAAALAAAWVPALHATAWGPWLLGLEVVVVGWLAVWPSPRHHRWAGGVYALLAYVLAWGTAGLSALVLARGDVTAALLLEQHGLVPIGVLGAALLLTLVGPGTYTRAFGGSRIAPAADRPPTPERRARARHAREGATTDPRLTAIDVPPPLERPRRDRRRLVDGPGGAARGRRRS